MGKDQFETQSDTKDAWVGVRVEDNHDTNETVTSIVVEAKGEPSDHQHVGINESGDEVFHTQR